MQQLTYHTKASRNTEPVLRQGSRPRARFAYLVAILAIGWWAAMSVASAQTNLTFEKSSAQEGTWLGTVGGDVSGTLVSTIIAADQSQPVWQIELYWVILADDPSYTFIARMTGTLDSETGAVQMTGTVVDGYMEGAAVTEAGQLQDAETSTFTGTITIEQQANRSPSPEPKILLGALRLAR